MALSVEMQSGQRTMEVIELSSDDEDVQEVFFIGERKMPILIPDDSDEEFDVNLLSPDSSSSSSFSSSSLSSSLSPSSQPLMSSSSSPSTSSSSLPSTSSSSLPSTSSSSSPSTSSSSLPSTSSLSPPSSSREDATPNEATLSMPVMIPPRDDSGESRTTTSISRRNVRPLPNFPEIEVIVLSDDEDLPQSEPVQPDLQIPGPSTSNQSPFSASFWPHLFSQRSTSPIYFSSLDSDDADDEDLKPIPISLKRKEPEPETETDEQMIERINPLGCCVCLEPFDEDLKPTSLSPVMITCGHYYCTSCLNQVQISMRKCAVCRKKFTKTGIIKIKYNTTAQKEDPYRVEVWNGFQLMKAQEAERKNNL